MFNNFKLNSEQNSILSKNLSNRLRVETVHSEKSELKKLFSIYLKINWTFFSVSNYLKFFQFFDIEHVVRKCFLQTSALNRILLKFYRSDWYEFVHIVNMFCLYDVQQSYGPKLRFSFNLIRSLHRTPFLTNTQAFLNSDYKT